MTYLNSGITILVDSNVLSETTKPRPSAMVVDWLRERETEFAVSPIILGELRVGIEYLPRGRKREALSEWYEDLVQRIPVFPIDAGTAEAWAVLSATLRRKGRAMPVKDSLIAATALQHGLTVATRNEVDYRHAGVKLVNPFAN
jgi:predicted nucleic acid-binding protein